MGAINTRLIGEYFDEVVSITPLRSERHHKVLDLDPRSPTDGILRTPIQVEKTQCGSLNDPRSPSCGISRTPLYHEEKDFNMTPAAVDGSYINTDLQDGSLTNDSGEFFDMSDPSNASSVSSPGCISDDLDLPESESEEEEEEGLQRSISDPDLNADSICLINRRHPDSGLEFHLKSFHQSFRKKCNKAKQMLPKISPNKQKADANKSSTGLEREAKSRRSLGDITTSRSPFSVKNVDLNSPLAIVQRKQASKLNMFRRHSTPDGKMLNKSRNFSAQSGQDKENLPYDC